jgi:gibberellin 20-oxidase
LAFLSSTPDPSKKHFFINLSFSPFHLHASLFQLPILGSQIIALTNMPMLLPTPPSPVNETKTENEQKAQLVFDSSVLQYESNIPSEFIWPDYEKPCSDLPELVVPPIDLKAILSGDPLAVSNASRLVNEACKKHGFFLVINHGVDSSLILKAHEYINNFFGMQLSEKQRAQRKNGDPCGYASSFTGRFSSKLPWKETLSFQYCASDYSSKIVEDYFVNVMGEDFRQFG